jgi:predicted phosphohydrolase
VKLFAIGDLHLPSARAKDMGRFGWTGHPANVAAAWDERVGDQDLVLVLGDSSWATRAEEVSGDLSWIEARRGKKVLLKGNHDFWWPDSRTRLASMLAPYPSIVGFLHNGSALRVGPYAIAGVRGWTAPEAPPVPGVDAEMALETYRPDLVERDAQRLARSVAEAEKLADGAVRVAVMHFPPLYADGRPTRFSPLVEAYRPAVCAYGHLHGPGIAAGFVGEHNGVRYVLVSCDAAGFAPVSLL